MIVVTTPTGRIGRHVLAHLVAAGEPVRVLVRDPARLDGATRDRVEVVSGSSADPAAIHRALVGAEAVFWCVPEDSQQTDFKQHYLGFTRPFAAALPESSVHRVVVVSSGGRGRAVNAGPISALHVVEELLEATGVGLRALRCGNFMENMLHQTDLIRHRGMIVYPLDGDLKVPTCAVKDIAGTAVRLLRNRSWSGRGGVAVHGPADLSANDMAETITLALGKPVRFQEVPPAAYRASLVEHGMSAGYADGLVDMFAEVAKGIYAAEPRTQETTTPTTFREWCSEVLKPG
jgi:uncharacterized protein YbjT (DUF2867 family)